MDEMTSLSIRKSRPDSEASLHVEAIHCQRIETITCSQGIWEGYNIEVTEVYQWWPAGKYGVARS